MPFAAARELGGLEATAAGPALDLLPGKEVLLGESTKVRVGGRLVSVKDLREGDVVTVELDELNPMKFARNITVGVRRAEQTARTP